MIEKTVLLQALARIDENIAQLEEERQETEKALAQIAADETGLAVGDVLHISPKAYKFIADRNRDLIEGSGWAVGTKFIIIKIEVRSQTVSIGRYGVPYIGGIPFGLAMEMKR